MSYLNYILEVNIYLILFYALYKLLLQKETFFKLNRIYLLSGSILALILPFFQYKKNEEIVLLGKNIPEKLPGNIIESVGSVSIIETKTNFLTFDNVIIATYTLVIVCLFIKLIWNVSKIFNLRKKPSEELDNGISLIKLDNSKMAFSFFKLIFIDPALPNRKTIIDHELVHVNQKHSIDVLFFEILQIINWFNPIVYILKKDVKLLHEYLADAESTHSADEKYSYAIFLIQNSILFQNLKLTNQIFGPSILKKRITMLNQKKSNSWARLKLFCILPLILGAVYISTSAFKKDYGINLYPNIEKSSIAQDTIKTSGFMDGINFAPPTTAYYQFKYDKSQKKSIPISKKLLVVNGKALASGSYGGIENADYIINLNPENGLNKYGEKGKYGAIEAFGTYTKIIDLPEPPPHLEEPNENQAVSTGDNKDLGKLILLNSPPVINGGNAKKPMSIYTADISLDRSTGAKLLSPVSEKGKKSISIYTDRGEKVFITADYKDDWDGKLNSYTKKPLAAGNYSYELIYSGSNNAKSKILRGYITLK